MMALFCHNLMENDVNFQILLMPCQILFRLVDLPLIFVDTSVIHMLENLTLNHIHVTNSAMKMSSDFSEDST